MELLTGSQSLEGLGQVVTRTTTKTPTRPRQLWKSGGGGTSPDHGDPTGKNGSTNLQDPNLLEGWLPALSREAGKVWAGQIKAGPPVFDSQTSHVGGCFRNWRPLALGPRESSEKSWSALFLHNSLTA